MGCSGCAKRREAIKKFYADKKAKLAEMLKGEKPKEK